MTALFAACSKERTWPGGVHLEFTGEDVTECLGGAEEVLEEQLRELHVALRPAVERSPVARPRVQLAELMRGRTASPR